MPVRIIAIVCAVAMLIPETITDVIGIAGLVGVMVIGRMTAKKQKN